MKLPIQKTLIGFFLFGSLGLSITGQALPDIPSLLISKPIERELKGGETHSYQIIAKSGEYISFSVEQKGIDISLIILGPDDKNLLEANRETGIHGMELEFIIAGAAGKYRIDIKTVVNTAPPGHYEVKIVERRKATENDKIRFTGDEAFAQANILAKGGTADAYRKALDKFQEAITLYKKINDKNEKLWLGAIAVWYSFILPGGSGTGYAI